MSDTFFSFAQGFVLGQLSVCIALFFFIKFFIFGESPSEISARRRRQRPRAFSATLYPSTHPRRFSSHLASSAFEADTRSAPFKLSSVLRPTPTLTTASILAKTYYNVHGHQPESVDWFNVLVAQSIAQLRNDAQQDNAILTSLTTVLNGPRKPDFLDEIRVTEINLGEEFPIFSNCRVIPVETTDGSSVDGSSAFSDRPPSSQGRQNAGQAPGESFSRLQARMDVDLSDCITLGIETKLVLNYPRPRVAIMPVALAVTVVRFSGTLSISFIPGGSNPDWAHVRPGSSLPDAGANSTPPTTLTFSFLPDYRLELSTHSLLGSRSRLQDVPKIGQLIESRLHDWFDERCVEPRFQQVALPSFWPRMRNTRGGEAEANEGSTEAGKSPNRRSTGSGLTSNEGLEIKKLREMKRQMEEQPQPTALRERKLEARVAEDSSLAVDAATPSRDSALSSAVYGMPGGLPT